MKKGFFVILVSGLAIVAFILYLRLDRQSRSENPRNAAIDNGLDQILHDLTPTVMLNNSTTNGLALKEAHRRRQEAIAELRTNASVFLPQILEELYTVDRIASTNEAAAQTRATALSAAFEVLGARASPLLPKIEEQFSQGRTVGPCIIAFQHIGGTKAGLILASALTNTNQKIRNAAMSALPSFSTNKTVAFAAVPLLFERLNDPSAYSRALAAGAIGAFGIQNTNVTNRLIEVAKNDSDFVVRISAIKAIETLGADETRVLSELELVASSDPESRVRQRAVDAVELLKGK